MNARSDSAPQKRSGERVSPPRWALILGTLVAAAALAGCTPSRIQHAGGRERSAPGFGHLSAVASGAAGPPGTTIAMRPGPDDALYGNDPQYIAARYAAERAIRNFGYRESPVGQWTLSILITHTAYGGRAPESLEPPPRDIHVGQGAPPPPVPEPQVNVHVNRPLDYEPGRTAVSLTLFQPGQPPVWTATLSATGGVDDPVKLVAQMTDAAMESFGRSAERDYVLSCNGHPRAPGMACLY